jgi:hypothetical protein
VAAVSKTAGFAEAFAPAVFPLQGKPILDLLISNKECQLEIAGGLLDAPVRGINQGAETSMKRRGFAGLRSHLTSVKIGKSRSVRLGE